METRENHAGHQHNLSTLDQRIGSQRFFRWSFVRGADHDGFRSIGSSICIAKMGADFLQQSPSHAGGRKSSRFARAVHGLLASLGCRDRLEEERCEATNHASNSNSSSSDRHPCRRQIGTKPRLRPRSPLKPSARRSDNPSFFRPPSCCCCQFSQERYRAYRAADPLFLCGN